MSTFHIPTREPFIDPRTGKVSDMWVKFLTDLNDAIAQVNAALDGLAFSDITGAISLAQLVAHASTHQAAGSDAIRLDDLAAPQDNTDLNATTLAHGLLPKLSGNAGQSLRGDGTWA